jgi:OOP family OmpA-OmpF porin
VPDDGGDSEWWSGADIDAIGAGRVPTPAPPSPPPPPRVVLPAEVLFELDSAALTDAGRAALEEMVEQALARSGVEVMIEGHTDDLGEPEYNLALSERRARAVADHFAQRGVDRARIRAIGLGETRPAASGTDDDARRKNRRVEISLGASR